MFVFDDGKSPLPPSPHHSFLGTENLRLAETVLSENAAAAAQGSLLLSLADVGGPHCPHGLPPHHHHVCLVSGMLLLWVSRC